MTKKLIVVASGGALVFALGGMASPGMAWAGVHPAGVAQAKLLRPGPTPVIRDSNARLVHPVPIKIWAPGDPPVITHSNRASDPARMKLSAPPDTPTVRDSAAQAGDPDSGGQAHAQTGDPDAGGQ